MIDSNALNWIALISNAIDANALKWIDALQLIVIELRHWIDWNATLLNWIGFDC